MTQEQLTELENQLLAITIDAENHEDLKKADQYTKTLQFQFREILRLARLGIKSEELKRAAK